MKKLFFLTLCFLAMIAEATTTTQPQFIFKAEYLYWHALYDQPYFVFRDTPPVSLNTPNGQRLSNPGEWDSGLRLEATYVMCECINEIDLRWTRFHTTSTQSYSSPDSNLVPTQGHPGLTTSFNTFAESKLRTRLDAIELLFFTFPFQSPANIRLKGGLNYTNIDFKQDIVYTGTEFGPRFGNILKETSFRGIGPNLNLDFYYPVSYIIPFCPKVPVYLHGDVRGALLAARSKASNFQVNAQAATVFPIDAVNDPIWRLVPVLNLKFGLNTCYMWSCFRIDLEVGYEFLSYHNAIQSTIYYTGTTGANNLNAANSFDDYGNLDFHGPYVSLGISF